MLRSNIRIVVVIQVIVLVAAVNMSCRTVDGQKTVGQETLLSPYRIMADESYAAFKRHNFPEAERVAKSLEIAWTVNLASEVFEARSPDAWTRLDGAKNAFIKPLLVCASSRPEPRNVEQSYKSFLTQLTEADGPWYGYSLTGNKSEDIVKTDSGVIVIITKHGSGRLANRGDIVLANLARALADGTDFRDPESKGGLEPIFLRAGSKVPGLLDAAAHLRIGDTAIVVVPPALGLGPKGSKNVPPNSTLTYFIEVADVKSKDIVELFYNTMQIKGLDAAAEQFSQLQAESFPDCYANPEEINAFGYRLWRDGHAQEAMRVFQLNVAAFPKYANGYDSLGEIYAASENRQLAVESYKTALSLNPHLETAAAALIVLTADSVQSADVASDGNGRMRKYQALARRTFEAFEKGDNMMASALALTLEGAWDREEGSLENAQPDMYAKIDRAMDQFIKPIVNYAKVPPDRAKVEAAYSNYVDNLKLAD